MYTPSMLSSAAIATAAAIGLRSEAGNFDITELVRRLQILTRVENVSEKSNLSFNYFFQNYNLWL